MAARRIAFCNNKGGVGKTRLTVNTAASLAAAHQRNVLIVDFDPQADASRNLCFDLDGSESNTDTIADVIRDVHSNRRRNIQHGLAASVLQKSRWDVPYADRIWFVPSRFDLEDTGTKVDDVDSFFRLRDALDGVDDQFDFTLVDVAPTLGPLAQMVWAAVDDIVLVTQPSYASLNGCIRTMERMYGRRQRLERPDLDVAGVVINQVRGGNSVHPQWLQETRARFGDRVWAEIPVRIDFARLDDASEPVTVLERRPDLVEVSTQVADRIVGLDKPGEEGQQ